MQIIEPGRWKKPWSQDTVCLEPNCGAKLLVEEADLYPVEYSYSFAFKCPICGYENNVDAKLLPRRIRDELAARRKNRPADYDGY